MADIMSGFIAGLKSWDNEKQKAEAKRLKQQLAIRNNYEPPKGMYTGNTPAEVNSATLAEDNPTYYKVHAAESGVEDATKKFEGFRSNVYKDTEGYDTIGYGHKLTEEEIKSGKYSKGLTRTQADKLYENDRNRINAKLYTDYPWVSELPGKAKEAVEDMAFNMGPNWLKKFPTAKKYLQSGEYDKVADVIDDSLYHKQVGKRAETNMERFRSALLDSEGYNFDAMSQEEFDRWLNS